MDKSAAELSRAWLLKAYSNLHITHKIGSLPDGHLVLNLLPADARP